MLKRFIWMIVVALLFVLQVNVSSASAIELDEASRTVLSSEGGQTTVVSQKDAALGQRLFNNTCSYCHNSGRTKTNPNVTLSQEDLSGANPARDNIAGIVDYLKNPTSYDGETDISLLHPNTTRSDLHPQMRNLTDDDLAAIASYILIQPNIRGEAWGGGKVVN
jgi:photosystem II cytochrome c550